MKYSFLAFTAIFFAINTLLSQSIEKKWHFQTIENPSEKSPSSIIETDVLQLENGSFLYENSSQNAVLHSGNYVHQNNVLVFYYNQPKDTIRHFNIKELTDSTFVFSEKDVLYRLKQVPNTTQAPTLVAANTLIKSNGFSFGSFWRGALGMVSLLCIAFLFSSNKKAINWKTVGIGLAAQLLLAFGVLKVPFIQNMFEWVGGIFVSILDFTMAGTEFLFKSFITDKIEDSLITFAVSILPTIIFFSALTSVLFYLGIIQKVVKGLAWLLSKLLKVSGAESLSVAGNIFLGQTESPLMIKAYLEKMNRSEILLVMIGGMATVAGGVLAAYIRFLGGGDPVMELFYAKHLLAASVMAAPGAIVISKILYPQTEAFDAEIKVTHDDIGSNILDAIANGTSEGLKLAVNVGAMLLVFLAFIAMLNGILQWFGDITTLNTLVANHTIYNSLSLEFILGYILAPIMWLIGVAQEDVALMGQLLGVKLVASEFVGYIQLAELKDIGNVLHLKYEKSVIMATYMLCGFANFASIGIQIGGIGSLAPGQRKTLSEFGIKALIGGTIASLISATIAGMIIG